MSKRKFSGLMAAILLAAVLSAAPLTVAQTTTGESNAVIAPATTAAPEAAPNATTTTESRSLPPVAATFQPRWVSEEQFDRQLIVVHGKVPNNDMGLFGSSSQMWRMMKYIAPGALGSGRALTLQISHPWVTAGIDEHSIARDAPLKRGRNTFRYLFTMIFGSRDQAMQAARDVREIHVKVAGKLPYEAGAYPQASEYRANEMQAMLWVHATLWETLVVMYEQSVGPLTPREKEKFYQETKLMAYMFGIPDEALPKNWDAFLVYCEQMRESQRLAVTPASKELAGFLFGVRGVGPFLWLPMQYEKVVTAANLPEDLRKSYGFGYGPVRNAMYKSTMWMSRVGHKITPGFITHNPAYKEGMARVKHERASMHARFQLWLAMGQSRLVNEY